MIELTGKEYGVSWNDPAARRTMLPKLLLQYQGKKFKNLDRQQDIIVGRVGLKKVLSHLPDAKPAMFLAKLAEVLTSMVWDHDEKPRFRDRNTRRWHHFTVDVSLAGVAHERESRSERTPTATGSTISTCNWQRKKVQLVSQWRAPRGWPVRRLGLPGRLST